MPLFSPLSLSEKVTLIKHLATMVRAGIPIDETLQVLVEESPRASVCKAMQDILAKVQEGEPLAKAMAAHKNIFDDFFIQMVLIGEKSGTLDHTLEYLVVQYQKDDEITRKVRGALIYPAIVVSVGASMGLGIAYFILPKLVGVFESFHIQLPWTTRLLLAFSVLLRSSGLELLAGALGMIIFFVWLVHLKSVRPLWHAFLLHIPIIGSIIRELNLARFTRTLGVLLKSGLPVVEALGITAKSLGNEVYRATLMRVVSRVQGGESMALSLRGARPSLIPVITTRMIAVGERTGKLDESLLYLGEMYSQSIDETTKNLSTVLEPLLLVLIGGMTAFVALSILSPIYQLTGSLPH